MVTALRPKPGAPRSYRFPEFHDEVLPNGIRLVTAPVTKLPVVTVLTIVDAGSVNDPPGKEGVASLTAKALLEGGETLDGAAIAERFERLGTSVESGADWDSAFIKITTLADRLEEAATLLGDTLSNAVFPQREVERLKAERLAELLQQESEPRGLADEKFAEFLYDPESRYSKPDEGSSESVSRLSREAVDEFYRSRYRTGSTTVVVVGDVSTDDARGLITRAFEKWPSGKPSTARLLTSARRDGKSAHIVHKIDAPQSELRVGHVGLPRKHPDFFPVLVMNAVLGGLFGSRINLNLREAHGYTYGASSSFDWRRGPGPFVVSTAVESEVTAAAAREILTEVDRIREEPISDEELTLATSYLSGVFPIRYETTSAIATAIANLVLYGLEDSYFDSYRSKIQSVTAKDVLEAARRHLDPGRLRLTVVGDATKIREPLEELGAGPVVAYDTEGIVIG